MKIFDSHCHLDDEVYDPDLTEVIARAAAADVCGMMVVGLGPQGGARAIAIAGRHEGIYAAVGIHPHDARVCSESDLLALRELSINGHVKAWGETGLDFNRMHSPRVDQERCFSRQLEIAAERRLPLIFHERDSQGRFTQILRPHWTPGRKAVVHCFSGTDRELDDYLEMGLYIGITGILTVHGRGRDLRRQVPRIPPDRLVVETDAPYLTPAPQRNKFRRNEPAFVRTVLMKLSELLRQEPERLAQRTWLNTCTLFNLPLNEGPPGSQETHLIPAENQSSRRSLKKLSSSSSS